MPEFGDVKQAHLPEQASLPGAETRFFKEGASGKSGDWISELGNAAGNFLEQGVKDILKAPIDIVNGAAKTIGDGLASASKGILDGLKEAIKDIRQDMREAKSSPREPIARREPPAPTKDGQREAKSEPKMRPNPETKKDFENRTQPQQNREQPQRHPEKAWGDTQSSVKAREHTEYKEPAHAEPMMRSTAESARDFAARSTTSNAPQASMGTKEVQAPTVRQNHQHASASPNQEKSGAATSHIKSKQTVESVLKEIRKEAPAKDRSQENMKAPQKSPERTR